MRLTVIILFMSGLTTLYGQETKPTNKHFWYSLETTATPEAIWKVWMDVPNWKNWDIGLKDASIKGTPKLGVKGEILSLEERKSRFKIVEFEEGKSYTYKTRLPLGSLFVKRHLDSEKGVTTFTHEVWFSGLTGGIFAKSFGAKFREMLPEVLHNIKKIVEGEQ